MSGSLDAGPWRLEGGGGLHALVVDGGAPASLSADGIELVQHAASAFEPGLVQLWVRDRGSGRRWPVLGAGSGALVTVHSRGDSAVRDAAVDDSAVAARQGHDGGVVDGAEGDAGVVHDALVVTGGHADADGALRWRATLALHPGRPAWAWHLEVVNDGPAPRDLDVVHTHDVALAGPGMLRANELYVSQYLDITPLVGPGGTALGLRQNLPQSGRHPWLVLAADVPVTSWASDVLDVQGWAGRLDAATGPAGDLPGRRRQHEHTLAALQTQRSGLAPGARLRVTFAGLFLPDHPAATSPADRPRVGEALELAAATLAPSAPSAPSGDGGRAAPSGVYDQGRALRVRAPGLAELTGRWPRPWRAVERDETGAVLSFFAGDEHVVAPAKEREVLRPHGTILRTGASAVPDPASLTVTAWMAGSPLSYLTRGNATTGRVLTTVRGYLGLHRAYGLRAFVEVAARWRLLDLPSAFGMTPDAARWVYLLDDGAVEVHTVASAEDHRVLLRVTQTGVQRRVLLALHLADAEEPLPAAGPGARVRTAEPHRVEIVVPGVDGVERVLAIDASAPVHVADDGPLFDDGAHRVPGVVTLLSEAIPDLEVDVTVDVATEPAAEHADTRPRANAEDHASMPAGEPAVTTTDGDWWAEMTSVRVAGDGEGVSALAVSLPWLVRDALVHHLSPRGLEQYSGGAWGTRDVTQGPLELLLALDRLADARALLLSVFAAQSSDGSWPQAFGFLPGDEHFRMEPAHGDIVHWPVLALARYLLASGDAAILQTPVPWYAPDHPGVPTSLLDHVDQALDLARRHALPGTHLVGYGHGDWNDSLQPADPEMARTMTSAWTITLHHQALRALAAGLEAVGHTGGRIEALRAEAGDVAADLRRYLLVDGELAGYAQLAAPDDDGAVSVRRYLVHPRDTETGLRHGSLQIIHALGDDLLDPQEAAHHVALVRRHLMGVDGVRLFDRPPGYHGGETRHFQRAETATFVGREVGLMYVHAHLRWCEAMARWGDAEALWLGLRQVLAPAAVEVVPGARRRQANTYASSSDAAVLDRADFAARYAQVLTGQTGLEAGWRVYSSGPGVLVRIVTQSLLGVRRRGDHVELDPVLPPGLDRLRATVPLAGGHLRLRYRVASRGCGVERVRLGGRDLAGRPAANPYRLGGLVVDLADLAASLAPDGPELEVQIR